MTAQLRKDIETLIAHAGGDAGLDVIEPGLANRILRKLDEVLSAAHRFDVLNLTLGDKVRLLRDVELYDGSVRSAGAIGKVTASDFDDGEMRVELQLEDDMYIDVYPGEIEVL